MALSSFRRMNTLSAHSVTSTTTPTSLAPTRYFSLMEHSGSETIVGLFYFVVTECTRFFSTSNSALLLIWFGTLTAQNKHFLFRSQSCCWKHNYALYVICQRPIVEFSLEDSRKLKIKEMRKQKNKVCWYQYMLWQSHLLFPFLEGGKCFFSHYV